MYKIIGEYGEGEKMKNVDFMGFLRGWYYS